METVLYFACFVFVIWLCGYCYVHYYSEDGEDVIYTYTYLHTLNFSEQLFKIASVVARGVKDKKRVLFSSHTNFLFLSHTNFFDALFEDRLSKYFIAQLPINVKQKNLINEEFQLSDELPISLLRNIFTLNYQYMLGVLAKVPQFLQRVCIAVEIDPKNYNEDFYLRAISYIKTTQPNALIVVFCDDYVWYITKCKIPGTKFRCSEVLNDMESFIAFSMCHFKIIVSNKFWWSGFLDVRYNSLVIYDQHAVKNPSEQLNWIKSSSIPATDIFVDAYPKVAGFIIYDHRTFNILCEAYRRIYPLCALKVLLREKNQMHIVKDVDFFRCQVIDGPLTELDLKPVILTLTEPFFTFLTHEEQFNYPLQTSNSCLKNTSEHQLSLHGLYCADLGL